MCASERQGRVWGAGGGAKEEFWCGVERGGYLKGGCRKSGNAKAGRSSVAQCSAAAAAASLLLLLPGCCFQRPPSLMAPRGETKELYSPPPPPHTYLSCRYSDPAPSFLWLLFCHLFFHSFTGRPVPLSLPPPRLGLTGKKKKMVSLIFRNDYFCPKWLLLIY